MKIILTTTSPSLESDVDTRFGRGAYFLIVDTDTLEWEAHPNPGVNASGGAGVQGAQFAIDHGVEAAISGNFGPNACGGLKEAGIAMYQFGECRTAQEAIEKFKAGQLAGVDAPTGAGRHARG
ncbi:MAG: NifB/NifX family molybdenum-iron cluster-binding protein [Anaerolineae bacterium]|nr:NifB/NifX family molybdenum-iron cluster-binding protein [Anaerolineae bacterium]